MGELHQFDTFGDGSVRRDAVQIAQLKDAHAERDPDFFVELGLLTAGEDVDQVIQLRLISQAAEDDAFCQGEIALVAGLAAKQVGGISALMHALEHTEGDIAGRGHTSSMAACG